MAINPVPLYCALLLLAPLSYAADTGYVGTEVCTGCHADIAKTQSQTNMAQTWQGIATSQLPANYSETHAEGPDPVIDYLAHRTTGALQYRVQMPGQPALEFPVETTIGGKRHGVTFMYRVPSFNGSPLPRAPLVEGRYIHSVLENGLALELGFSEEKPTNFEEAFGRVLTPSLESRCFSCHPAPRTLGTRVETGVACENCHGPGQPHLAALAAKSAGNPTGDPTGNLAILNPRKLPVPDRMKPCTQCHEGSGFVEDPLAVNLLISNQVTGLKNSECWRQSAGQITCTNCHNPHQDAPRSVLIARSEATCLRCHSATVTNRPALCPVNRTTGCVGCHMPVQIRGAFHLADHWIRVRDEQKTKVPAHDPAWRSTVAPRHLYLREIVLDDIVPADKEKAAAIRRQLRTGTSFFELARANSLDRATGVNGGYMGDLEVAQLDPAWSASARRLLPGEISDVLEANGKFVILQRMPRNFREDADARVNHALALQKEGKAQESTAELFEALKIYPHFLRALTYLGISYARTGNPGIGAGILEIATRLYPKDQGAHFNLAVAYGAMGSDKEIPEYQRTLEIDPDYAPAYLNWGAALFAKGQFEEAIQRYRQGIQINPLNASLHYSLSVALDRVDQKPEAESEMKLAAAIDPKYAAH